MKSIAMFFPEFHRAGLGRKPLSASSKLARQTRQMDGCCLAELDVLLGRALPSWVRVFKSASGIKQPQAHVHGGGHFLDLLAASARSRWQLPQRVAAARCRSALAHVHALCAAKNKPSISDSTAAYCKARRRLPACLLIGVLRHITEVVVRAAGQFDAAGGRLLVMDGTAITLQDSDANRAAYHYASGQKPGCGFPQMHLLGLFDLRTGAWLRVVKSAARRHDCFLAWKLIGHLRAGDTLIADRAFCSYAFIHECEVRGVHVVMRLHQARARTVDMTKGKSLGRGDGLHTWIKPGAKELKDLPDELQMRLVSVQVATRGHRPEAMYFATTLRDEKAHSAEAIALLYLRRWDVELFFDDIKTSQRMDMLRCKSPAMVARELLMHMIAYNLVRVLLVQAESQRPAGQEGRLSYKGTLDRLHHWHAALWGNPSGKAAAKCYAQLLEGIANDVVLPRPGRYEPRLVKRRRDSYSLLTRPRAEIRRVPAPPKHRAKAA
jgi:hypothetical protein